MNNRNCSRSGMKEYFADFIPDLLIRPLRVLHAHARGFYLPGHPIQLLCQLQTPLAGHLAKNVDLLGSWLFVRKHRFSKGPHKSDFALASASSSLAASLPPPRALPGFPPPFPPIIGAIVWMIFP